MESVKICPACGSENPVTTILCACGVSLATVPRSVRPEQPVAQDAVSPATESITCREPTCGATNPPGQTNCTYCNAPLGEAATVMASTSGASRVILVWPWGEEPFDRSLNIGRDPSFSPLADRLAPFSNISRRHATLRLTNDGLEVEDLASTNGTFVDGARLPARVCRVVRGSAVLRFAASLNVTLRLTSHDR